MPGKRNPRTSICEECEKPYEHRGHKPGVDGIYRCKPCNRKKYCANFKKKHGVDAYHKYQQNNPTYQKRRKAWSLKAYYGLSWEQYEALCVKQNYLCAICDGTVDHKKKALAVDHDHKTGRVRGLLCHRCNLLLGKVNDDTSILLRAVQYLEIYQ